MKQDRLFERSEFRIIDRERFYMDVDYLTIEQGNSSSCEEFNLEKHLVRSSVIKHETGEVIRTAESNQEQNI